MQQLLDVDAALLYTDTGMIYTLNLVVVLYIITHL